MLKNFFKLNEPWKEITSESDLVEHFQRSNDLRNVLYRPDRFSPRKPYRLKDKTFENVSFSKTTIEEVVFRDCSFTDCLFIGSSFIKCEFRSCTFSGCNPHKVAFENSYVDPNSFKKLLNYREHTNIGLHLFNQLEQNARKQEQYPFIASAAYLFKKWNRYHLNWTWHKKYIGFWRWLVKWLPDFIYDLVAGYGWKIQKFIISSIVLVIIIAFTNHVFWNHLGMVGVDSKGGPNWIVSSYYTVVTLTTLGYGDITPTTQAGMTLASIEAIIGLIWLSVLASIIFRRIFR